MRISRLAAVVGLAAAVSTVSSDAAVAASKMPQMNFANPLTTSQVVWMAIIMIVLYLLMSRWALPEIGNVIEGRRQRIADDLEAARRARTDVDRTVAELDKAVRSARDDSRAAVATAVAEAKEKAKAEADMLNARLDSELERAEQEVGQARQAAVAALRPVAEEVAESLVQHLLGRDADRAMIRRALDAVQE